MFQKVCYYCLGKDCLGTFFIFLYLSLAGLIHDDLKVFLLNNIPKSKKKSRVLLGISDPKLGSTVQETLDICCQSGEYTCVVWNI